MIKLILGSVVMIAVLIWIGVLNTPSTPNLPDVPDLNPFQTEYIHLSDGRDPTTLTCTHGAKNIKKSTTTVKLPGGKPYGTLRLRYNTVEKCKQAWAKISVTEQVKGTVHLRMIRRVAPVIAPIIKSANDDTVISRAVGYSQGCVYALVYVVTRGHRGPKATTPCLQP